MEGSESIVVALSNAVDSMSSDAVLHGMQLFSLILQRWRSGAVWGHLTWRQFLLSGTQPSGVVRGHYWRVSRLIRCCVCCSVCWRLRREVCSKRPLTPSTASSRTLTPWPSVTLHWPLTFSLDHLAKCPVPFAQLSVILNCVLSRISLQRRCTRTAASKQAKALADLLTITSRACRSVWGFSEQRCSFALLQVRCCLQRSPNGRCECVQDCVMRWRWRISASRFLWRLSGDAVFEMSASSLGGLPQSFSSCPPGLYWDLFLQNLDSTSPAVLKNALDSIFCLSKVVQKEEFHEFAEKLAESGFISFCLQLKTLHGWAAQLSIIEIEWRSLWPSVVKWDLLKMKDCFFSEIHWSVKSVKLWPVSFTKWTQVLTLMTSLGSWTPWMDLLWAFVKRSLIALLLLLCLRSSNVRSCTLTSE